MTRERARLLLILLAELEREPLIPPEFSRSIGEVRGLALAALSLAEDEPDGYSRRVPTLRVVQ